MEPSPYFCDLSSQVSLIKVVGEKARDFLQGQFTCDLTEVTETETRLGGHCNAKGRLRLTGRLLMLNETLHLLLPTSMVESAVASLQKYALLSKVTLTLAAHFQVLGYVGTCPKHFALPILAKDQATLVAFSSFPLLWVCVTPRNTPRFLILGDASAIGEFKQTLHATLPEKPSEAWRLQDIEEGIPHIYPQTREVFTPHMVNYIELNGVHFKKGCYIGQEIIARTQYLGKSKRHLSRLKKPMEHLPLPGETLYSEQETSLGIVVDSVLDSNGEAVILYVSSGTS